MVAFRMVLRKGFWLAFGLGVLALLVIAVVLTFRDATRRDGDAPRGADSVRLANPGDCIGFYPEDDGNTVDEDARAAHTVPCADPRTRFRVLGLGKTDVPPVGIDSGTHCEGFPDTDRVLSVQRKQGLYPERVLCLRRVARQ